MAKAAAGKADAAGKSKAKNVMRNIVIDKIVISISVGEPGDKLTRASKVLESLTDQQKPVQSKARLTIRSFGIRRNDKIGTYVTVRGPKAAELLERGLRVKEFELRRQNFSATGNFGFGINEHIDLGIKYDPSSGIFGLDYYVVLKRRGFRVARRRWAKSKVGHKHKITSKDAIEWFQKKFEGVVLDQKKAKVSSGYKAKKKRK